MTVQTLSQAVTDYEYGVLNLEPTTRRWYRQKMDRFVDWCSENGVALEAIRPTHVRRFLDDLRTIPSAKTGKALSDYTLHGYAQVVKGFLNWAIAEDLYGLPDKLTKRLEMPKVTEKVIEVFTREQIKRLLQATKQEMSRQMGERDQAIIRVLLSTGIRASELCGLTLPYTYLTPNDAHIRVLGKGRKQREVGLNKDARASLHRYVTHWREAQKDVQTTFVNRPGMPLTPDGLDQMLYRLRDWSGISGVRCSAHTFRHTFAVEYLTKTGDIYRLSRVLGHGSVKTTEIYLKAIKATDARRGMDVFGDL
jgi:site-specific recombinase XerD